VDEDFTNPSFDVPALRRRLHLSQTEFAHRFGIPAATVRHWEAGDRRPRGPALSLLRVIAYNPGVALRAIGRYRRAWRSRSEPETRLRPSRDGPQPCALTDEVEL
jgi:transcriptional regulator with XRE-family HTH domain